jgi:hypothetical protein
MLPLSGTAPPAGSQRLITPKDASGFCTARSSDFGAHKELRRLGAHRAADAGVGPLPPSLTPLVLFGPSGICCKAVIRDP